MLLRHELTYSRLLSKETGNILSLKFASPEIDFGSSFDWTNKWSGINYVWWVVVGEINILISVILIIYGQLDWHFTQMKMIPWCQTLSFS